MYNCEHTPVKDVPPQEKQSRHLVRTERNDAPEDLRKAINSVGESGHIDVSTWPTTERASQKAPTRTIPAKAGIHGNHKRK